MSDHDTTSQRAEDGGFVATAQTEGDSATKTHPLWTPPQPPEGPTPPPQRSRRARWVALVLALALSVGAGVGLGRMTAPDDTGAPAPVADREAQPEERPEAPAPRRIPTGGEPVAAVAEALLPSVVQIETPQGLGSGVVYDPDGLVLTAAHVIEGARQVRVTLSDGRSVDGRVLGSDANTDVAVVRVDESGLPVAPLATGRPVQVGQLAIAIGSPFGLDSTVTSGIVSAVNRAVIRPDGNVQEMIQTDAPINPGNSGGALADRRGRVIGINDAIRTTTGGSVGVGFAIPIDVATWVAERIVDGEPVNPAVLGISGTDDPAGRSGALVTSVQSGSAAAAAGIREGDLITALDGERVATMTDLAAKIRSTPPETTVTLTVVRGEERISIEATLGNRTD